MKDTDSKNKSKKYDHKVFTEMIKDIYKSSCVRWSLHVQCPFNM